MPLAASAQSAAQAEVESPATLPFEWKNPAELSPQGSAPRARWRLLGISGGQKRFLLVLRDGDELLSALLRFATEEHVASANFTALGGVRNPTFAWFDPSRKQYKVMSLQQPAEGLGIVGNLTTNQDNGRAVIHAHGAFGLSTGEVRGGHLVSVTASPTMEVSIETSPQVLKRALDPDTGIYLIDPHLK